MKNNKKSISIIPTNKKAIKSEDRIAVSSAQGQGPVFEIKLDENQNKVNCSVLVVPEGSSVLEQKNSREAYIELDRIQFYYEACGKYRSMVEQKNLPNSALLPLLNVKQGIEKKDFTQVYLAIKSKKNIWEEINKDLPKFLEKLNFDLLKLGQYKHVVFFNKNGGSGYDMDHEHRDNHNELVNIDAGKLKFSYYNFNTGEAKASNSVELLHSDGIEKC